MAAYDLEAVLYDISTKREVRKAFLDDADAVLTRYPLDTEEQEAIRSFDVHALQARGVNPMLTMGLWITTKGPRTFPHYLSALRADETKAAQGEG